MNKISYKTAVLILAVCFIEAVAERLTTMPQTNTPLKLIPLFCN
jgi:hypothetical protein